MARYRSLPHPVASLALSATLILAALGVLLLAAPVAALLNLTRRLKRPPRAEPAARVLEGEFQVLEHSHINPNGRIQ